MASTLALEYAKQRNQKIRQQQQNRQALQEYIRLYEEQAKASQEAITVAELQKQKEADDIKKAGFLEKSFATSLDLTGDIITGAAKGIEGVFDFGVGIVGALGGLVSKDFQQGAQDLISYDVTDNFTKHVTGDFGKWIDEQSYTNDMGWVGEILEGTASGLGQMLPSVAITLVTAGAGAPAAISNMAGTATLGVSAAGTSTEEAYNDGADYLGGLLYGTASGATEMVTEKMFGGATKNILGKGYLDNLVKELGQSGAKKVLKDMAGEAVEEGFAELANPLLKGIYKGKVENFLTKEHLENIRDSAIIGAGTSLAYGGTIGRVFRNVNNANEALSELNSLRIKEENLHASNKLFEDGNEGKISSLRNRLYTNLSESVSKMNENERNKYISKNNLGGILNTDGSLKIDLSQESKTGQNDVKNGLASVLDKRYTSIGVKGKEQHIAERLKEQNVKVFTGELSAVEQENYNKFKKVQLAFSRKGVVRSNYVLFDGDAGFDAYIDGDTMAFSKDLFKSGEWLNKLVHETTHFSEKTKEWEEYADFLLKEIDMSDANNDILSKQYGILPTDIKTFRTNLANGKLTNKQKLYLSEVIATKSEFLFSDEDTIERLTTEKRNIAQKIYDKIRKFIKVLKATTPGERDVIRKMQKAEYLYEKALSKAGTEYAIEEMKKSQNIDKNDNVSYSKTYKKQDLSIITRSSYNHHAWATNELTGVLSPEEIGDFNSAIAEIKNGQIFDQTLNGDYIIEVGDYRGGERTTLIITDGRFNGQSIEMVVKFYTDNLDTTIKLKEFLYERAKQTTNYERLGESFDAYANTNELESVGIYTLESGESFEEFSKQRTDGGKNSGKNTELQDRETNSNKPQFSLSKDSDGNSLTETQAEFFKDSKIRDENGNLQVMYHGTLNGDFYSFGGEGRNDFYYFAKDKKFARIFAGQDQRGKVKDTIKQGIDEGYYNPKIFEVYLNVKNPFIVEDVDIVEWALYQDRKLAQNLRDKGYDALMLKDQSQVIVLNPNQIKETINIRPTFDDDIRYALKKDDSVNKLVAIHNISEDKLLNAIGLGGLAVPSIAIINSENGHENFGDISLIFKKDTIDPSNYQNKVFNADVYSKRFPQVVSRMTDKSFDKFKEIFSKSIDKLEPALSTVYEDLNEVPKRQALDILEKRWYFTKDQFLQDNGINIEMPMTTMKSAGGIDTQYVIDFANKHPEINDYVDTELVEGLREEIQAIFDSYYDSKQSKFYIKRELSLSDLFRFVDAVLKYNKNHNCFIVKDASKFMNDVDSKIKELGVKKYREWLRSIMDDLYGDNQYFRNDKDMFDYYGNRRTFNQLYNVYNLENIVKYMAGNVRNEEGYNYGTGNIRSILTKQYKTIKEIKADEGKLMSAKDMDSFKIESDKATYALCEEIIDEVGGNSDNQFESMNIATDMLVDIAKTNLSDTAIIRQFKEYGRKEPSEKLIEDIRQYMQYLKDMPTEYFEAKPQRVVEFDEVVKVFAPEGTSDRIIEFFESKGINIQIYGEDTPTRAELVKELPQDIKFALSNSQIKKELAKVRKEKFYTRKESEQVVHDILSAINDNSDFYATLKHKNIDEVATSIWEKLNTEDEGYRAGSALEIADYIIDNAIMTDILKEDAVNNKIEHAKNVVTTLKEYLQKFYISDSVRAELKYKYDKDYISVLRRWGSKTVREVINGVETKRKSKLHIDDAMMDLQELGLLSKDILSAEDGIIEINEMYLDAVKTLKVEKEVTKKEFSKEELEKIRQDIAREILVAYDKYGKDSKLTIKIKGYRNTIDTLRGKLQDSVERNKVINKLFSTVDRIANMQTHQSADVKLADVIEPFIKRLKKIKTWRGNLAKNVRDIMVEYSTNIDGIKLYELISNPEDNITNPVSELIEGIARGKGELTTTELRNLDLILNNFIHNAKNYDKIFFEGRNQSDTDLAIQAIYETKQTVKLKDSALNKFKNWIQAPIWRFLRLGNYRKNSVMARVFNELKKGVDKQTAFNRDVAEHFKSFFDNNKKYVKTWHDQNIDVKGVTLSKGQMISLYMLSQREQAKSHLLPTGSTGVISLSDENRVKSNRSAKFTNEDISTDTINEIEKMLTDVDKEFIGLAHTFFDEIARNAKAETDKSLFGITNVGEKNYIPIRVADDQIYHNVGDTTDFNSLFSVYMPSFNKDVKPNANNKIVVENIIDIIDRHSKQMGAYYGLAIPIKAFNRIYNKKLADGSKLVIEIAEVDADFKNYVGKLFSDMQGNPKIYKEGFDRVMAKVRSLGAKAALGLNLKVLANQFVSLPASAAIGVKYKNIMKGLAIAISKKTDYDSLEKYSPMLYDRFREGNNIDVGLLKEGQGIAQNIDNLTELATAPISKLDKFICGAVWNACLEQTKSNAYEDYSDEHYKAAAKLTEEAVIKTQANYIPLYRPEILRSKSSLLQMSTMFMSEPLQQFSLLSSSIEKILIAKELAKNSSSNIDAEKLLKEAKHEAGTAISAVFIDTIILTMIAQLFKWVKGQDDEDDKIQSVVGDFAENYIGMIPFARDIYNNVFNNYDITNLAYTGMTNISTAIKNLSKVIDIYSSGDAYDQSEVNGLLKQSLLGITQVTGIPLKNLLVYTSGIIEKFSPSTVYSMDKFFYDATTASYLKDLNKAIDNGDDVLADTILNTFLTDEKIPVKEKELRDVIKSLYSKGYNVLPKSIGDTIVYNGEDIKLTQNQKSKFRDIYQEANTKIKKLVSSQIYKSANVDNQAKAIKYIYDYYYKLALEDLVGEDVISEKDKLFLKVFDICELAIIVKEAQSITSEIDKSNNIISGSRKKKVQEYINSLRLSASEKYMIMGYLGYSNASGGNLVKTLIQSLKLSKNDKEKLYAYSGY